MNESQILSESTVCYVSGQLSSNYVVNSPIHFVSHFNRTQPVMCLPINVTVDPPIIHQKFFHCSAPLSLNTPVATVTICITVKEIVNGDVQGKVVR